MTFYLDVSGTFDLESPISKIHSPFCMLLGLNSTSASSLGCRTVVNLSISSPGIRHYPLTGSISNCKISNATRTRISVDSGCRAGHRCGAAPQARNELDGYDGRSSEEPVRTEPCRIITP